MWRYVRFYKQLLKDLKMEENVFIDYIQIQVTGNVIEYSLIIIYVDLPE